MIVQATRVLLVEDVLMIAKITARMLAAAGGSFECTHTTTLADALAALDAQDFDLVLLDLNLPDSQELETVSRVIKAKPEVPIIVLTASTEADIGLRAVQLGAQDFLVKGEFNHVILERSARFAMERHRLQRTLRQLAVMDDLTGLYNRRGFNALNPEILQRAGQSGQRGFVCFFDLDRFKQINDECGHAAGDEALREFAGYLQETFRKTTLLVRLGGDEFVAMGFEQHHGQTEQLLARLQERLAERNTRGDGRYALRTSWGIAYFGKDGPRDIAALTEAADAALYHHKESRRHATAAA